MLAWIDALTAQARDAELACGPHAMTSPPWGWGERQPALPP